MAASNVGAYFFHYAFLRTREFEGKVIVIEIVENIAYFLEHYPALLKRIAELLFSKLNLNVE